MSIFSSKSQEEMERLIEENDELKNRLHVLLQKQKTQEDFEAKLAEARHELSEISFEERDLETKKRHLISSIDEKSEEQKILNEKIQGLEEIRENLENTIKSNEEEIKSAQENFQKFNAENEELETAIKEKKSLLEKLERKYSENQAAYDLL